MIIEGPSIVKEPPWLWTLPVTTVPDTSVQLAPAGTVTFFALPPKTPLQIALPPPNGFTIV